MKLTITKEMNLTDGEIKVIKTLMTTPQYDGVKSGWWEFRDSSSEMCRGNILNGADCWELLAKGILIDDDDSWHTTFRITDFGKEIYQMILDKEEEV